MGNSNSGRRSHRGSAEQQALKEKLLEKSYEYLNNNFSKFTQKNKIHIALTLIGKDITQKIDFQEETKLTTEQREERITALNRIYACKCKTKLGESD